MDFYHALHRITEGRQRERVMRRHHLRYLWREGDLRNRNEEDLFDLRRLFSEEEPVDIQEHEDEDWVETYAWDFDWEDNPVPLMMEDDIDEGGAWGSTSSDTTNDGIDRDWWNRVESTPSPPPVIPGLSMSPDIWDPQIWQDIIDDHRLDYPNPLGEWPYHQDSGAEDMD